MYPLSNLSNNKAYQLTTARGSLGTNGTQMVSTNGTSFSASNFAIISYEGNYYLWSVADSKWVSANSQPTLTTNVGEAGKVVLTETNAPYFFMGMGSMGVNMASGYYVPGTNQPSGIVVNGYTTSDPGNQYIITEAADFNPAAALQALEDYYHPSYFVTYVVKDADNNTLFTSTPQPTTLGTSITELPSQFQNTLFYDYNTINLTIADANTEAVFTATLKSNAPLKFTADATTPVWYHLTMRPDATAGYPTYVAGGTPNVTLPATNAQDESTMWAFIGSPYGGFQIVNRAAGTSLVLGSANAADDNTGGNTYATLAAPGTQTYEIWTITASSLATGGFFINNAAGQYLNKRSSANLAYWTGGHDIGSTFVATEVIEGAALYDALIAQLEAINWGSGLGQYSLTGSLAGYAGNEAALIAQLKSEGYSSENLARAQAMLENNALNMPQANTFLRIRSINGDKAYLKAAAAGTRETFTATKDEQTIFLWDADGKLISYHSGLANNNVREAGTIGGGASQYSILPAVSGNIGQYSLTAEYNNGVNYLYSTGVDGSNADRNTLAAQFYQNNSFTLEEVTELPITLTNVKSYLGTDKEECYTTMYMPVAVTVTGAEVYTVSDGGNNTLDVDKLDDAVVPANTPVVLYAEAGSAGENVTATATVCTTTNTVPTSVLTGTVPAITYDTANDNVYVLSVANNKLGFYKFEGSVLKGFRAYYQTTGGSSTRGFVLNFGGTATGINAATLNADGNAYDLQGRRVNNAQKGVFIINGKKVVK